MPPTAAIFLESGIREPYDSVDMEVAGDVVDMWHAIARGAVTCVRHHLGFQARFDGMGHKERCQLVSDVADVIRLGPTILSERTTNLMSNTTTALKPQEQTRQLQLQTLKGLLESPDTMKRLAAVAPKHMTAERLTRLVLAASSRNPKILECTPQSVLLFTMKCSETGLEPIGAGGAYPIPRKNNKTGCMELTFLPDYRGLMNCAKNAGCITDGYAEVVYAADEFSYELGLDTKLTHKPARGNRGELEAAYCVLVLPDGKKRPVVMYKDEIEGIRNQASESWKGGGDSPWKTYASEMWKKTVVRRAMKQFAGASPSLATVLDYDETESEAKAPRLAEGEIPNEEGADGKTVPDLASQEKCIEIDEQLNRVGLSERERLKLMRKHGVTVGTPITSAQADEMLKELGQMEAQTQNA